MEIVPARPEEAEVLTGIAHAAKRHWGYPERWIEAWKDTLTIRPEFIASNLAYCAIEESQIIGFCILTNEKDGLHLDHLWVLPDTMRRGIGRALFQHAIEQARKRGYTTMVIEADPHAEGFYRWMGARRIGVTRTEVDNQPRDLPLLRYELG